MKYFSIGQNMFMRTVIHADDGRVIPVLTMGPIGIAPELIAEIGTPMIPEEQYAAIVNGGG